MHSFVPGDFVEVADPWGGRSCGVILRLEETAEGQWLFVECLRRGVRQAFRASPEQTVTLGNLPQQPAEVKEHARWVRHMLLMGLWEL